MGKVNDALTQQSYQNWAIIGLLAVLSVGMLMPGALNSITGEQSQEEQVPEGGDFAPIDYDTYSVPLTYADAVDTAVLVSSDAEMPDEYEDYTVSASEMVSELQDSDLEEGTDYYVSENASQFDADVVSSGDYKMATYDSDGSAMEHFSDVSVPSEIEKFRYVEERPVKIQQSSDLTDRGNFQVAFDDFGNEETEYSSADDGNTFTQTTTMEVENGTELLGDVSVANVASDVDEMTVTVETSDGVTVYEQTDDATDGFDFDSLMVADGESARTDDYDSDALAQNPVMEDGDFTVEVEADLVDGASVSGVSAIADVTVNDLEGNGLTLNVATP